MPYNFYAQPKDPKDLIIVTPQSNIHSLKFILIALGDYSIDNFGNIKTNYTLINSPLTQNCIVEEHHYYKMLGLNWTKKTEHEDKHWYDEDSILFSHMIDPSKFIKGMKEFFNKEFILKDFVNKLESDSDFKYITEILFGNDIDYVDMYFTGNEGWILSNINIKEIRTINYKNALD